MKFKVGDIVERVASGSRFEVASQTDALVWVWTNKTLGYQVPMNPFELQLVEEAAVNNDPPPSPSPGGGKVEEWQDIKTAPKDGSEVLLWAADVNDEESVYRVYVGSWSTSPWVGPSWVGYEYRTDTEYLMPTHWMPLPPPPVESEVGR